MTTHDQQQNDALAARIAALLDESTKEIDSRTADKLLTARKEALAHFQEAPQHAWAPVLAGRSGRFGRLLEPFSFNAGFPIKNGGPVF